MSHSNGWHIRLTWTVGALFALASAMQTEAAEAWKTGDAFRQQLAASVGVTFEQRALGEALASLSKQLDVAVFLDRRVDPGQSISLRVREQPAQDVWQLLAAAGQAESRAVGPVIYVGPAATTAKLPTLAALRRQEAAQLPAATRARLQQSAAWRWIEPAEPRQLLSELAREAQVAISGSEQVPHDLWSAGDLPPLIWTDRLALLLAGFDLTFEFGADGQTVRIVPAPDSVAIEKRYTPRGAANTLASHVRRVFPHAEVRVEDGRVVVKGLQEDHEQIELLLAGRSATVARAVKGRGPARFTLTVGPNDPAGAVLRTIATQLGKELKYDAAVLEKLKQNVPVSVKDVTLDELLRTTLQPLGLTYRLDNDSLEVVPR